VDERERVFQPFQRLDTARTPGGGVGLGLTIARRVAEAHGGTIAVSPTHADGSGCRFRLEPPLVPTAPAPAPATAPATFTRA
jgi:signal transduction histidine kinase